jgi:UDP-4-amino-4,6-dideoxy-N-acetyl-beta-L-altrosamine N-acetyltransferase
MESEKLLLRRVNDGDKEQVLLWRNQNNVRKNMYNSEIISKYEHNKWWDLLTIDLNRDYLIFSRNGFDIGVVGFLDIEKEKRTANWMFYASSTAPKGTGSLMEFCTLEYFFRVLNFRKLNCEIISFNEPVIGLHKKFGFSHEGTFREQHLFEHAYWDVIRMGMLSHEWDANRHRFDHLKIVLEGIE